MEFSSTDEFYDFVELIQQKLNHEGFTDSAERLSSILHDGWYSTSSEVFGEIRLTLQAVVEKNAGRISNELLGDIKMIIAKIDESFRKANSS